MNREECITMLIDIIQDSEYYEYDRGNKESIELANKRNDQVLEYIKKNLN